MRTWLSEESMWHSLQIFLHMSLSLFSFQGETPNLCARKPYPRLYTGGRAWRRQGERVSNRTRDRKSERGKNGGEVIWLVHGREWLVAAECLTVSPRQGGQLETVGWGGIKMGGELEGLEEDRGEIWLDFFPLSGFRGIVVESAAAWSHSALQTQGSEYCVARWGRPGRLKQGNHSYVYM